MKYDSGIFDYTFEVIDVLIKFKVGNDLAIAEYRYSTEFQLRKGEGNFSECC